MQRVEIYDTTLRDGSQAKGVNFSLEDKLAIVKRLDEFGVDYIEGGWPGSNPKDRAFFEAVKDIPLKNASIAAFGSTRRAKVKVEEDSNIRQLVEAGTPVVAVFGKTWDLHVVDVLRIPLEDNIKMIYDSVSYLRKHGKKVFFDAEHFFDGFAENEEYAMKTLEAAVEGGAECLVLCDTNGGTLPHVVGEVVKRVKDRFGVPIGIHAHNDSDTAVAASLEAVRCGAVHVQGTVNGMGERTGNADLCSVIPALILKMGRDCVGGREGLKSLTELARFVYETANLAPPPNDPYVGSAAFAHKGGIHVDAVKKNPRTYEHIEPAAVGNERQILISELVGRAGILSRAERYGISKDSEVMSRLLEQLKELEGEGYEFESAEGSFDLLIKRMVGEKRRFFELKGFRVFVEKTGSAETVSEASVKIEVSGEILHAVAEGDGPVNALDGALRKALSTFYPSLKDVHLVDYKVRVINPAAATAAKVRVVIVSSDGEDVWGTVGVSENIIEASWQALVDSIEYKLFKESGGRS